MPSLRNQGFNQAQKDHADSKILNWLPFGKPGWNLREISLQSGIKEDRARRSLKRLVERGHVVKERHRKGASDEHVSDLRGHEHLYYRPRRHGERAI